MMVRLPLLMKVTVPTPGTNTPWLCQLPPTFKLLLPDTVTVAPVPMVMLLLLAVLLMVGVAVLLTQFWATVPCRNGMSAARPAR